jgi:protein-S-isoprenylcysteine O-methyltransferase Ste14
MLYILLGVLGHIVLLTTDLIALKKLPGLKPAAWAVGWALWTCSVISISVWSPKITLPFWSIITGWVVLAIALSLMIVSLFVSIPFRKTYVATGVSDKLVTSGMYALVRHPWTTWYALLMLSLVPVTRAHDMLIATPLFSLLGIIAAIIQDRFIYSRLFTSYDVYRRQTPMLIPNRKSITTFISSFRQLKTEPMTKGGNPHV